MAKKNTKPKSPKRKKNKGESAQSFLPIRDIRNGVVETTDGRYLKILEVEPINFALRSSEEQFNIISSFASWLKISPIRLQFKAITRRADSDKHISPGAGGAGAGGKSTVPGPGAGLPAADPGCGQSGGPDPPVLSHLPI